MRSALLVLALVLAPATVSAQALDKFKTATDDRMATQHYQNGWDLLRSEKWEEASREFQAAIDLKPNYKLAFYGLGRAGMGQRKFAEAIRAYETCRDLYERQASQNIVNAQEAERLLQDDLTSIDLAINRLQTGPQTAQTSNQIAQLNMQKDRLKNRTGNANNMSLTSPVPAFVSLALGSAYFRSNRLNDAETWYKKAIDADSKYGEAHNNLAALYLMTERYDEAAAHVKAAEKAGFRVNPAMKAEIETKRKTRH
jgi:tetratricopeptide (TPR) repeat protein